MRLIHRTAALVLAAAGIVACGSETTEPPEPVPTTLSLSATTVTLTALGATQQLTATVRDQNNAVMSGVTVAFNSGNDAVATVTLEGLVTAMGNGTTTVTVSVATLSTPVQVTVSQVVTQLVKTAGDQQTDTVGHVLPVAVEVELRDARGNPVPGGVVPNATVQFTASGGGSPNGTQVTANAGGRASTAWTLGTVAGAQQLAVSLMGGSATTQFSATATAAPADTVVRVSGNNQVAPASSALPDPLVVRVEDQYGNPVAGHQVGFAVTLGGGSVTPTTTATGADGRASTQWTLGPDLGVQTAEAQTTPALPGSPVSFSASAANLSLISVAPDTLVEGTGATLTGTGFDATPGNNTVTIGGVAAAVTAASPTSLTVTVPSYTCQPARAVNVLVTVGAVSSNTLSHPLKPAAATVNLGVGQQQIILDPGNFCLQFAASAASEAYLIGVQSLSGTPGNLTPARLIAATGFAAPAPPALLPAVGISGGTAPSPSARALRWARHRAAEAEVRAFDERVARMAPAALLAGRAAGPTQALQIVGPGVAVGDTVQGVRVWPPGATSCNDFTPITTVVRAKGARGIWLEDVANPLNGYTAADFDSLSNYLDNIIFDTDTSHFGSPGDFDANQRIVVVVTKGVNQQSTSLLGFVLSCDFFARTSSAVSNEGEFFYAKAPDPTGTFGSVYSRDDAFADAPFLIAHEFTHIIQFARRLPTGPFTSWLMEGLATMAEEVNGFAVTGRTPGQNYGFDVAFNNPASTEIDWHVGAFTDLALYFGFESSTTRKAEAPHECTWIGRQSEGNNGPCIPGREVYGVPWSVYRWVSDQFGPTFTGGERGLQKALIGNLTGGYANLASTVGVSIDTLLAQWAAALYVDDRVPGAAPRLTFTSWDLVDIESGLFPTARLQPIEVLFSAFDQARNVRAGSTAYFRVSGTSRPATAIRARTGGDAQLAEPMTLWIVRLQ
jgi:hypothetical protein